MLKLFLLASEPVLKLANHKGNMQKSLLLGGTLLLTMTACFALPMSKRQTECTQADVDNLEQLYSSFQGCKPSLTCTAEMNSCQCCEANKDHSCCATYANALQLYNKCEDSLNFVKKLLDANFNFNIDLRGCNFSIFDLGRGGGVSVNGGAAMLTICVAAAATQCLLL